MCLVTLHQQLTEPEQQSNITGVKTDGTQSLCLSLVTQSIAFLYAAFLASHREQHLSQTEEL